MLYDQENDPNENLIHNTIQRALGRSPGNPLFVVSQKTLTGHSKGGAAAFPLAATLASTTIMVKLISKRFDSPAIIGTPVILGIGVIGLFGLVFIGRFFGRLSTGCALIMLLAPLLCWATEMPLLRDRKPWLVGSVRLVLVAIPLIVVLALAKRDFDREMIPLLGQAQATEYRRTPTAFSDPGRRRLP